MVIELVVDLFSIHLVNGSTTIRPPQFDHSSTTTDGSTTGQFDHQSFDHQFDHRGGQLVKIYNSI